MDKVKIETSKRNYEVDRWRLICKSEVMQAEVSAYQKGMKNISKDMDLSEYSGKTVRMFIDYINGEKIHITEEKQARELFEIADQWIIPKLLKKLLIREGHCSVYKVNKDLNYKDAQSYVDKIDEGDIVIANDRYYVRYKDKMIDVNENIGIPERFAKYMMVQYPLNYWKVDGKFLKVPIDLESHFDHIMELAKDRKNWYSKGKDRDRNLMELKVILKIHFRPMILYLKLSVRENIKERDLSTLYGLAYPGALIPISENEGIFEL